MSTTSRARAQHPNSPNRYMLSSLPLQMAFFPYNQVETISPRPILMIVGVAVHSCETPACA